MTDEKLPAFDVSGLPDVEVPALPVDSAHSLSWQVATEAGGAFNELTLVAGHSIECEQDQGERLWSILGLTDDDDEARFHAVECELPAGWYELTGTIKCTAGAITLPMICYGQSEERQAVLPAPDSHGVIRAMLLFFSPITALGFAPSIEPARFRMQDFRLRRLSRSLALRHMLGSIHEHEPFGKRVNRFVRFALHANRGGLSDAAGTLYRDYLRRIRAQALANYEISELANELEDADLGKSELPTFDAALTPYLIGSNYANGAIAIADISRRLEREAVLLAESGLFDEHYYLRNNPDVARSGLDPLFHFCQYGWRGLRNPSPDFDIWWYWANHLDPSRTLINPLVHYALQGKREGLSARPALQPHMHGGHAFPAQTGIRRICLFAGYDIDGIIDECVVDYLRELSRHADVYYLSDGDLRPGELEKMSGITKGAWAVRHRTYDFGSYSMLAGDLVGWDVIEQYDELIFVNDSAYLLRDLDEVFARMDARTCDWWGLQATKGLASTQGKPSNRFDRPIPMEKVKKELLRVYEQEYVYDFHVGSYFLAFRKPVILDADFRKLINGVTKQRQKLNIIRKYEIGITRHLIGSGHSFDTFIDCLHPFHPLYTETAFELIRQGFPLFKRYLLTQNHYKVPLLADWKERLRKLVPDAPVEHMERNLLRVANYEKLNRSLHVERNRRGKVKPYKLLRKKAFEKADAACEKHDDWWAFPVCAFTHTFSGNERAIFESVKHDAAIKKIILVRKRHVDIDGENVVVVSLRSREGQYYLMRARQIFIKHSPTRNLIYPVSSELHNLINVWHGIPLKRIGYASLDMQDKLEALGEEHAKCKAVISSSKVDTMAMASAFYPLSYNDVWMTGLPRNDFILRDYDALPEDLRQQVQLLRAMLDGRRLVLFVPTFKHAQAGGYYHFTEDELNYLRQWSGRNNVVLGVREHMADGTHTYFRMLSEIGAINLGNRWFPNVEVLYREADLLITDYSSCFIDFMLTGKPMLSFAYDYDNYVNEERGLFYDLTDAFPGRVCKDFEQLAAALETISLEGPARPNSEYVWKRKLFFDYLDDGSSARCVARVKSLYTDSWNPDKRES